MKRKSIAMALALAMVLTAAPVNMAGAAEDDVLMEEVIGEESVAIQEMSAETAEEMPLGEPTTEMLADEAAVTDISPAGQSTEETEASAGETFIEGIEVVEEGLDNTIELAEGTDLYANAAEVEFGTPIVVEAGQSVVYRMPHYYGCYMFVEAPATVSVELRRVEEDGTAETMTPHDVTEKGTVYFYDEWFEPYLILKNNADTQGVVNVYTDSVSSEDTYEEFYINRGESATMSVKVSHTGEEYFGKLQYQWYECDQSLWQVYSPLTGFDYQPIEGATDSTYTVTNAQHSAYYYCEVRNNYEFLYGPSFHVNVYSNLKVKVDDDDCMYRYVDPGQSVSLAVEASSDLGAGALRYQWYEWISAESKFILIPGATSATFQTPGISRDSYYECHVSDGCNSATGWFELYIRDFSNIPTINEGTVSGTLQADGEAIYKLLPTKTARYDVKKSFSDTVSAVLLDENRIQMSGEYRDDEESEITSYNLIAGKAYYLIIHGDEDEETSSYQIPITVVCEHVPARYLTRTEAGCVTNGSFKAVCANCKSEYEDILNATGQHTYGGWSVAQAPTVLADGVQVRACTACGAQETAPVAKLAPTMSVNVSSIPLKVGQSTTKVKITDLGAGDSVVSWTSSNPKAVKVDASGKITAQKKAGGKSATITVTLASGLTQNVTVKVQKSAVNATKISVPTKKLTLEKGAKYSVVPVITPITTLNKVSYSSSNKKVATVSKNGVITAKKSGKAKITVKCGKKKVTITVTVPKTKPTGITNIPAAKILKKGKSTTLKAKLVPASAEAKITYKSSNKKVATVSSKGKVKAKKKGTAVIKIKAGSIVTTCVITVK